ncbi:hypothetical protein SO802_005264 [Lithocarpus litseifolius]|uniref:Sieve element occlusion N-terminal domain-containing protein n=1 Tax=Lithocarpus litseifolius TaxID=425828 RepID=A0AAW2DM99_9ROSI
MACKPLGEDTAQKTSMSILEKLSKHAWHAKALLTLAAFAVDYGDFWLLALLYTSDKSAKSVGILKGMPNIYTNSWFQKHSGEIAELNKLINATLDVIEHILKLEDLAVKHAEEDLPEFSEAALHYIPLNVYYAIQTVAACTTRMCCLFNDKSSAAGILYIC